MPKILAITNPKGGTGKSTTTAALASLAAADGLRTLLIDLDPQQTASFLSRGEFENDTETAAALFDATNPTVPSALARATIYDYELVPAGALLSDAEDQLRLDPFGPTRLRKLFKRDLELEKYDIVIIDTSANKTRILTSVLMAATHILIPMQASNVTMKDLADLLPIIDGINEQRADFGDAPLINHGIVFTMVKDGTRANESVIASLTEQLRDIPGVPVNAVRIPHSTAVEDAALARAPVTIARPSEKVAQRYNELWAGLSGRVTTARAVAV